MPGEEWNGYYWLLGFSFISALIAFVVLLFVEAPYGRFNRSGWGPEISNRWGWCIMESPAVLVFGYLVLSAPEQSAILWLFLVMWQLHYIHRAFIYPFTLKSIHPMPWLVVGMAVGFNILNGYLNGTSLRLNAQEYVATGWFLSWQFQIGLISFAAGTVVNKLSDAELRRIRSDATGAYEIPTNFLHKHISCPNYLGEIIQWCGWALATWSLAGLSFAIWTIANLLPRALATHRWYLLNFPDYPPRKALIPGIL